MDEIRPETIGPIVGIVPLDDATGLARRAGVCSEGGATARVFARDHARAERRAADLRPGAAQVNAVTCDIDLSHGGTGQAGTGHDRPARALHDDPVAKRITRGPVPA